MATRRFFDGAQEEIGSIPLAATTPPVQILDSKIWVRVSGVWRQAVPYVKVSGAWQVSKPKFNDADTWKP